jgi:hypothetical protein
MNGLSLVNIAQSSILGLLENRVRVENGYASLGH